MLIDVSEFRFYSLGIVGENKALDSKEIEVLPIEVLPFLDGELTGNVLSKDTTGLDKNGGSYTAKVNMSNCLTASWINVGGSNRRTAPDVRRGERVFIYRFADTEHFYWTTTGLDEHLRKLETHVTSWSGTKDESLDSLDPDNCYFLEVSTHKGLVTFKTSKKNNEPYSYTIQINTKKGILSIADDVNNFIELISAKSSIELKNNKNSTLHLNRDRVFINGDSEILLKSGKSTLNINPNGTTLTTPKFDGNKA